MEYKKMKDCPRCKGTGKVPEYQGRCNLGFKHRYTDENGKRLDNCMYCNIPYGYQKKNIPNKPKEND